MKCVVLGRVDYVLQLNYLVDVIVLARQKVENLWIQRLVFVDRVNTLHGCKPVRVVEILTFNKTYEII